MLFVFGCWLFDKGVGNWELGIGNWEWRKVKNFTIQVFFPPASCLLPPASCLLPPTT
ncbi:MAG: hypothetical protein F6K47_13870 [Symploca sp. SIO2E6]|nr:hypothetical protein [Symploca sp. SIO2E6]